MTVKVDPAKEITYLTDEEFRAGKPGYVLLPYKIITTHAEITDENGTRRIRQVSRWTLFKLWANMIYSKMTRLFNGIQS
jgi:hypothetical protein